MPIIQRKRRFWKISRLKMICGRVFPKAVSSNTWPCSSVAAIGPSFPIWCVSLGVRSYSWLMNPKMLPLFPYWYLICSYILSSGMVENWVINDVAEERLTARTTPTGSSIQGCIFWSISWFVNPAFPYLPSLIEDRVTPSTTSFIHNISTLKTWSQKPTGCTTKGILGTRPLAMVIGKFKRLQVARIKGTFNRIIPNCVLWWRYLTAGVSIHLQSWKQLVWSHCKS